MFDLNVLAQFSSIILSRIKSNLTLTIFTAQLEQVTLAEPLLYTLLSDFQKSWIIKSFTNFSSLINLKTLTLRKKAK